jgi:hypothetical protein
LVDGAGEGEEVASGAAATVDPDDEPESSEIFTVATATLAATTAPTIPPTSPARSPSRRGRGGSGW